MKGLLILFLAVNAFAFETEVTNFFRGFQKGLKKAEACKADLATCGMHVGSIVSFASREDVNIHVRKLGTAITKQTVQDFLTGFVTGLRRTNATNSNCVDDFNQAINGFSTLFADILTFDPHNIKVQVVLNFVCSGVGFLDLPFYTDCNVDLLWQLLSDLDFGALISNYIDNMCDLNNWFGFIGNCVNAPSQCGYGIGYSIRTLIGWYI